MCYIGFTFLRLPRFRRAETTSYHLPKRVLMSTTVATRHPIQVDVVLGTRPEAIKLAPVVLALRNQESLQPRVISTGQHRDLVAEILGEFGINPDQDLDLLAHGQSLTDILARAVECLGASLRRNRPDMLLVQGDTTSALAGALAAFYERIPVAHVEAGLRSGSLDHPFPEEANRALIGRIAQLHFAPTPGAASNLIREGADAAQVHVCGNTVIDALHQLQLGRPNSATHSRLILVTSHRRENWGPGFTAVCQAVRRLIEKRDDVRVLFVLHPNPALRAVAEEVLGGHPQVTLSPPLSYVKFVTQLAESYLVLSDSGGVQEEATALGKPLLLLRETTERPEGVEAGTVRMVGTNETAIVAAATRLLDDSTAYRHMAHPANCFGDGFASQRIVQVIEHYFGRARRPAQFAATGASICGLNGQAIADPMFASIPCQ